MTDETAQHDRKNVYAYLAAIRARPSMYVREKSLSDVEALVLGYYGALSIHGIDEGVPEVASHFARWLRHRFNWSLSCGWAYAITENSSAGQALDRFFELLDEYGALTPLPLYSVRLRPEHQPTGRRVVIGYGGRMRRPDAIQIVQYHPEPLFFLRFTYGTRTENDNVLFDNGRWTTSVEFAKRWVQDELDVAPHEWTPVVS
jgi:hypothetical protein